MAESGHLNIGSQHSRGSRNNHVKSVQRLSLSTSSVSNSGSASDVGSTSGHFSVGQSDESNRSLMVPFNSDELDILRHNTNQFLSGSSSTMNEANNAPIATSSGAADMSADGAVFPNGQSSSGYVLNGVVDESGNVLFEAVEPEMGSQGQLFQSHLQSHHTQHDQQHAESSLHPPASEMSSTRALDSQCLNLLNLHSTMSSAQSDTTTPNIVSSHPNFPGISVHSSTAAGLIQALSAVNRGMSNTQLDTSTSNVVSSNNNFPGISVQSSSAAGLIQALNAVNKEMTNPASFLPSSGRQPENSAASMEPTFNSALSDDPAGSTSNTAQVFLTQQHHQQHQILNIMLEGGTGASNTNIISNTPSVNLHHRRRESAIDYSRVAPGDNITSANINTGEEVMSSLGQRNSSIVTVSLDQQLSQHEEERQRHQQQQHEQQQHLWIHQPNQGRVMSVQDAVSRDLGICQLPTAVDDTAPQATQQEAQLSEVSGNFQPLGNHLGNNRDNRDFHDMQSQLSGIFNQQQQSAFHVTTASSSSFGPASPGEQPHPYAVIGADSEAAPSDPGLSQQQHVIVENRTVDSSCLQPGQFTLVFDTGSQTLQIQRMTSPSDCTVSQSILSMEGSEAQASPSPAHFSSKNYSQPQVNQSLSTNFTCGNSSQEVTTSTMPPQLRHISDRAGLSRVDSICNRRQAESSANSTSTLASVVLKIEKPEADGVAECDTTQEDIEGFEHQSPATSSNIGESQDELHSTVLQPAIQRSEAISPVEVTMDTTLECNNLTSFQSVAIEASRDVMQPGASSGCLSSGVPNSCKAEPQSGQLATLLTDTASLVATTAKQPQSVRKSRRLELVAQESKVSLKKRNYKSKQYDPAMLWCEDCMDAFSDQCPMHRLTAVPDRIVLSRAWASCPNQIQICRLPEAQLAPEESYKNVDIPQLDMPNKHRQYFETADENQCNWMMFVRPARTFAEQNLVAYQHKRNVFFSSTKIIEPKQELKVWYAAPYAEQMGVKTLELTEDDIQALDEADGRFACSECSRRFRSWAALQRHLFTHDEEESEEEIREEKLAQLQEYVNAETDGDTDFVPGFKESSDRQLSSRAAVQQRIKGTSKRGRFKHGRKRLNVGEGNRKKTTFLAKTLKKYKRAQNPRPCSDSVLQTMKGMYRRRGKLSGGNEWMCTHCGLTFDNASLLNLHTLTHAAEDVGMEEIRKLAIPQTIEFSSDVPASLTAVLPSDSPGRTSAADTTLQPLLPVSTNLNTAEVEGKPLNVACPKCNVVFNDHKDLMDHVSTHAQKPQGKDGRPFCCGHCSKSFSTTEKLARHQMVHGDESEKPLECPVCSKRVMTNSAMACHMKTHSNRKYFDCPICDTDFNTVAGLREHAQISHADQNGHYPCKECAKVFEDFALLKKHVRAFHSNKTFQCQECSKVFPRLDKLRLHMLRHTSHREFMCETCGRQFKRKDKLREHMKRVHDGRERQNQQGVVGGAVVEEQQVVTTTKFTPKVMPSEYHRFIYKCHTCLLGFKRRGMLVNHLAKRHPEIRLEQVPELNLPILKTQKDFYCQYCEKIYKSASKRKMHIQKSHPGCAVPPSSRKKLSSLGDSGDACPGVSSLANGFNNSSFSHTVSSITTMPHGCKFCHKQYASKTKLIQHQRKQHPDIAEPQNISRRKIKKTESDILQIAVGGEERYEPVLPITVVNQGGDATNLQATDLLNLAMSELNYSGASGVASLASLISSLGGGATAATPAGGGGAMVHIQSNTGQLQPATIDLSQLNQALQTFSVTGQGPAQAGLTTVLQTPLSPNQHQHHQQQQQHQQQIQLQQHQIHPQQQQQLTVVTPSGSQTINLSNGGQFIARAWPANFATQAFR